jgi:uncharacterized cupin superfamily protein
VNARAASGAGANAVAPDATMFLSAAQIAALPGVTKVHAFNRDAVRLDKSLGDLAGLQRIGVHVVSVQPGCYSTEFHHHRFAEECVYVLAGQGYAHIGDARIAVAAGDFIGCPANGVGHAMEASGAEPLVCLVVGQRLPQDVIDYPRAGKHLVRNDDDGSLVTCACASAAGAAPCEKS